MGPQQGLHQIGLNPELELEGIAALFRALADPARVRILNLLTHSAEVPGRTVEAVTGYSASKISRHFAYLKQAGLVQDRRDGLWHYYSLRTEAGSVRAQLLTLIARLPELYDLLAADVQRLQAAVGAKGALSAQPEITPEPSAPEESAAADAPARGRKRYLWGIRPKRNVLFLCQSNAARSQMAEAFLRKYGGDQFEVFSAGLVSGEIHPMTRQVMAEIGVSLDKQRAKGVNEFLGRKAFAYVITLCLEAEEECPRMFPGANAVLQWPLEDVANARLPDAEKLAKFRIARDRIERKVKDWLKD